MFSISIYVLAIASIIPLFMIMMHIFREGISSISPDFLVTLPKPVGEDGGGIANALVGTIILISIASLLSLPFGVMTGLFLAENRKSKVGIVVRLSVEVLQGVPSIVIGLIVYMWIVKPLGHFSTLSGGIALAIMMLPIIVRTTEETLKLIPESLKNASLALGAPYYHTMLKVILPAGINGIVTGILVSVARIAGETAPLLFTAFGNPFMNLNPLKPIASLPQIIFNYAISPYEDWHRLAWGASIVLVLFILLLNLLSRFIAKKFGMGQ
jgi:phosphate transport system permease protein